MTTPTTASTTRIVRAAAAVLATITATVALAWFVIAATPAPAHADALCDAMRARFGPGYPCISVPTNTFTPTAPAGPTTTGPGGQSSGGPQVGIDVGPGPGEGNGTPIVPVPGAPTNALPGNAPAPTPTAPALPGPQNGTAQSPGGASSGNDRSPTGQPAPPAASSARPPSSAAPTPAPASNNTNTATTASAGDDDSGTPADDTQQMLWLLAGAAAIVAGASSTRLHGDRRPLSAVAADGGYPSISAALRSWLPGGGSERATIGTSQYVLINDPTSPRSYVFDEDVPPGGHIAVNPDGSATIYDRDGQAVSRIQKPWAYDSLGRPQRTWYTVGSDGRLIQHIDPTPDALYPILADPDKNSLALARQQQRAAQQGTPAHQEGTGTPLNKSPNADPPPPPPATPPPANTPDYGDQPHNQAATHSGLPPSQTASGPDLVQQEPAPSTTTPGDDSGLRDTLTAPITTPSQPESSPTQGPQPAPGQNLTYSDFLNNQLGGEQVGTIQQRPGPDNSTQYFRTNPDGTETPVTAVNTTPNGELLYTFNDGTTLRADPTARYRQAQEYIYKEMITNRNSTYFHIMSLPRDASPAEGASIAEYILFYEKVKTGGEWDHKPKFRQLFGLDTSRPNDFYFPVPDSDSSVYYDIYSNIHYGYIGTEAGIPSNVLIAAANGGTGTTGVNDTGDDIAMKAGIQLSEQFGKDLSQQQLNDQIAKVVSDIKDAQSKGDPTTQVRPQ